MYVVREDLKPSDDPKTDKGVQRYYIVGVASFGYGKMCQPNGYNSVYSTFFAKDKVTHWIKVKK